MHLIPDRRPSFSNSEPAFQNAIPVDANLSRFSICFPEKFLCFNFEVAKEYVT